MNDLQTTNNSLTKGYLITPQQFIDGDYAAKVECGECEVHLFFAPPPAGASESEKAAYAFMLTHEGNTASIGTIEKMGEGYYFAHEVGKPGTLGLGKDQQLLVWPV